MNTGIKPAEMITYSDEWIAWALEKGAPGDRNSAPAFAKLPTLELRQRAASDAVYHMNCAGGNWSYAVSVAVNGMIRRGFDEMTPAEEYTEKRLKEKLAEARARLAAS